jgi:hypothetical protein
MAELGEVSKRLSPHMSDVREDMVQRCEIPEGKKHLRQESKRITKGGALETSTGINIRNLVTTLGRIKGSDVQRKMPEKKEK